jgi:hypothetical protein
MFFKQFYDQPLAQASYLIGCQATGDAIVVDPIRDVRAYLEVRNARGCASRTSRKHTFTPTSSRVRASSPPPRGRAVPLGRRRSRLAVRLRRAGRRHAAA